MLKLPNHEIYALRYASITRPAQANFLVQDVHDLPMRMDYFIWLIRDGERSVLVDTGFNARSGTERQRELSQPPVEALAAFGVDAAAIEDVVITHMHYDHAGNLGAFPGARFHIQDREMAYATGRCMCQRLLRHPFDVEDAVAMVRHVYDERVVFHDGDGELRPGITLHLIPGHTQGLQAVRVHTRRGWVLLASDALHFIENMERQNPFPIFVDLEGLMEGWKRVRALAETKAHIIPGHDPIVTELFRRVAREGVEAWALHEDPLRGL